MKKINPCLRILILLIYFKIVYVYFIYSKTMKSSCTMIGAEAALHTCTMYAFRWFIVFLVLIIILICYNISHKSFTMQNFFLVCIQTLLMYIFICEINIHAYIYVCVYTICQILHVIGIIMLKIWKITICKY